MQRAVILGALTASLVARAALGQSTSAQAEELFKHGKALLAQGDIAKACDAFDASERLQPTIPTLLNQADCRERNHQLATAWGLFLDAERQTRAGSDQATVAYHKVASDRAAKLEPRVSSVTIHVADAAQIDGLEIVLDGKPIDRSLWEQPTPVDGGSLQLVARAPGRVDWKTTLTVSTENDKQSVDVPLLEHVPAAEPTRPKSTVRIRTEKSPWIPSRTSALAVAAGAVVSLGGALGFELWGDATYSRSKIALDPADQKALWRSADHERYAAEAFAATGIVAASAAIWLYVRSGRHHAPVTIEPSVAPGGAAIVIGGELW